MVRGLFLVPSKRANVSLSSLPVNQLPSERKVADDLHCDQDLLFNVNGSDHLVEKLASVSEKLTYLQI
jgi:hypothetical protein